MGRTLGDFRNTLGDNFENVGSKMEEQFENTGNQFGQHMSSVGNNIDEFGSRIENSFRHQFGNNLDVLGTNLMSHFDDQMGNMPFGSNVDVFGMFGRRRTPWWKKENVCVEREVLEEEDEQPKNINIVSSGNMNFHMQASNI